MSVRVFCLGLACALCAAFPVRAAAPKGEPAGKPEPPKPPVAAEQDKGAEKPKAGPAPPKAVVKPKDAGEQDEAAKIAALIEQLGAKEAPVRAQAAAALGAAKAEAAVPKLIPMLDDPDDLAQWQATVALAAIGAPALPPLIESLNHAKERVRWKAESALKMLGAVAVPALVKALSDPRLRVRQSAAYVLGEIKDARGLEALAAAMGDKDEATRWKAATSLTKFGPQATDAVAKRLAAGPVEARRCAAWVFQQTRDPGAVPHLAKALKDADEQVRWKAAIALQKIGRAAAEPLLALLRSKKEGDDVKSMATWILEGIKDIAVQTALRDLRGPGGEAPARPKTLPKSVTLAVASEPPRASVFLDDKYAGVTPLTVAKLAPGHHLVKLTKRDHLPWTKLVELLRPEEKLNAKLAVKPKGTLIVTSEPTEADVFIDGELEGKTPLEKPGLDPNPYSVRIERQNFEPWESEVDVAAGKQAKVHGVLKSKVEAFYLARLKRDPNDASCHTELGHYYLVRGNLDASMKAIARAVEVVGTGTDTSAYSTRVVQEIGKMWVQQYKYGGGLSLAAVRKALHAAIHGVWKRHAASASVRAFLAAMQKSVGVDFTQPPA